MTQAPTIDNAAVDHLAQSFSGRILRDGDTSYDDARSIFNAMLDRLPALIARCATTQDVVAAVNFARERDLLVSVKGGGHAPTGHAVCDGGLMIDLSLMKKVTVDPQARVATAEGGGTWGEFDAATQEHGFAVTGCSAPSAGSGDRTARSGLCWL